MSHVAYRSEDEDMIAKNGPTEARRSEYRSTNFYRTPPTSVATDHVRAGKRLRGKQEGRADSSSLSQPKSLQPCVRPSPIKFKSATMHHNITTSQLSWSLQYSQLDAITLVRNRRSMPLSFPRIAMALFLGSVWKRPICSAFVSRAPFKSFRTSIHPLFVAQQESQKVINLHSIKKEELEEILESWGFPKYRADQVWQVGTCSRSDKCGRNAQYPTETTYSTRPI